MEELAGYLCEPVGIWLSGVFGTSTTGIEQQ